MDNNPNTQTYFPSLSTPEWDVHALTMEGRVNRAIDLLRKNEPVEGYFLAFSGGKDSCVIKALAKMAGVKFEAWYASTTIDPPELIHFLKEHHSDVQWELPKYGSMLHRVRTHNAGPPTRLRRWCCREYKEGSGKGRVKVMGVRAAESHGRRLRWRETVGEGKNQAVCPIVYWTDEHVWEFLRGYNIPYCKLYDEGFKRLGCVGCPLNPSGRVRQFERWPRMKENWKKAVMANWENMRTRINRDGKPYFQARFKSAEEFWLWWLGEDSPDYASGDCQGEQLWVNFDGATAEEIDRINRETT
jgi:phosphoadenosine phosphosulfate reductase